MLFGLLDCQVAEESICKFLGESLIGSVVGEQTASLRAVVRDLLVLLKDRYGINKVKLE